MVPRVNAIKTFLRVDLIVYSLISKFCYFMIVISSLSLYIFNKWILKLAKNIGLAPGFLQKYLKPRPQFQSYKTFL